jgi:hypothetical protein
MKKRAAMCFGASESGIENTTKAAASNHPMRLPGAIEASEARGQAQFVASQSLPSDVRDRKVFEALGFTFGEPYKDDPIFAPATLPAGWTKRGTDHDMHSEILDEKGRVRAGVFYKAAFYDRRADMSLRGRYRINQEYGKGYTSVYTVVLVVEEQCSPVKSVSMNMTSNGRIENVCTAKIEGDTARYILLKPAKGATIVEKVKKSFPVPTFLPLPPGEAISSLWLVNMGTIDAATGGLKPIAANEATRAYGTIHERYNLVLSLQIYLEGGATIYAEEFDHTGVITPM